MKMASLFLVVVVLSVWSAKSSAVTTYIGDEDSFGFPSASILGLVAADGGWADRNRDGKLGLDEVLPDLDGDGIVAAMPAGTGDVFDHRSAAEAADPYALWTDVALSNGYAPAPGPTNWKADSASFTFHFTVPTPGDDDYDKEHFVNLVYADYDTDVMEAVVEGVTVPLIRRDPSIEDGYIWTAYAKVPWSKMLDGEVTIEIIAPGEPYIAFDYALLDTEPIDPVPAPGAIILGGIGAGLVGWLRRRRIV